MKSKAAVLTKLNAPLELMELEIPPLKRGQVLVEMHYAGICRSQVNEIKGYKGEDRFLPHTLGHEGSGIVLEVGAGVKKVKKGDSVVLSWIKGEGDEMLGMQYQCGPLSVNSGPISTFLEKAVLSENRVIPIDCSIPLREAALFGCAIPTGAGIVYNELNITQETTLAIFGLGGIGLSSLMAARLKGAKEIIAIDKEVAKLRLAKELGATQCFLFKPKTLLEEIWEVVGKEGVDCAIESAGDQRAMELAFSLIRSKGTSLIAGNVPQGAKISIDPFDLIKGKRLVGTWGGKVKPDRDIPFFIKEFMKKPEWLSRLIAETLPLSEINQAIKKAETGIFSRMLIKLINS